MDAPDGFSVTVSNNASSTFFVLECLSQSLSFTQSHQNIAVTGLSHNSLQAVISISISPVSNPTKKFSVMAVVVSWVTYDQLLHPIAFDIKWMHLTDLPLADLDPGRVDMLLGVDTFVEVLRQGQWIGKQDSTSVFETEFCWVLAGKTCSILPYHLITTHHACHYNHRLWYFGKSRKIPKIIRVSLLNWTKILRGTIITAMKREDLLSPCQRKLTQRKWISWDLKPWDNFSP